MKIRNVIIVMLLLLSGMVRAQDINMNLPVDKAVRIGKLSNGLTYFIRHNNWPENRANFYIAQKVGSIEENESQRGLAHFLEHMAFNGSDHFKGNNLIEWCRAHGIEFGADLNAYTGIEETVYNINNVPTQKQSVLDSCLLILRDWSAGLSLEQAEIDKERGVIHEEWRLRTSPQMRMLERNLPKLFPGSKYGLRFPIGLMSVVDNFKRQELVDYYHKWYHPSHQGIIVVGDVDVDKTEAEIKRLFGNITNPRNEAPLPEVSVPDNNEPIVIIDKDKEYQTSNVRLMFKHKIYPDSLKQTQFYLIDDYAKSVAISLLNSRLDEAAQQPGCPFVSASVGDGSYMDIARSKDAFSLNVVPKDMSKTAAALQAAYEVARQAAVYGFTPTEYRRYQDNLMSMYDKMYSNKDKRYTSQFYDEILGYFLTNEPMPGIDFSYNFMKKLIPALPLDAVNDILPQLMPNTDKNMVIINYNNEKAGEMYPTATQLLNAVHQARVAKLVPYVDKVKNQPLIQQMPAPGTIKKESKSKKFGYDIIKLSNGVTVLLKKTDYKKDQVAVVGLGGAGSSMFGEADAANIKVFNQVINSSGLGGFSVTELSKALSGKIANANMDMGQTRMSISANSTPKDVETMMQLIYLYFTNITKDPDSFNNLMQQYALKLKNRTLSPEVAFADSVNLTLNGHGWRVQPLLYNELPQVNYDRILNMAQQQTANAKGWVFQIIGNYDEATIRPLICRYLGSLPSQGKAETGKRLTFVTSENIDNTFYRKMETPKANAYVFWFNHKMPYSLENNIKTQIAGQVLEMIYLQKIREDASAAYSCGAQGVLTLTFDGYHIGQIVAFCPMKPEKKDIALKIIYDAVPQLAQHCDKDMLEKVKQLMLKQIEDRSKTNDFWSTLIMDNYFMNVDNYTQYRDIVKSITPESLSDFMKTYLLNTNKVSVIMLPQE